MIVPQRGNRAYEHEILYAFSIFYAFVPPVVTTFVLDRDERKVLLQGMRVSSWILLGYRLD